MIGICESIEGIRPVGKVTCHTYSGKQILHRKLRVEKNGFYALPDDFWLAIDTDKSKKLLIKSLCYHLEDEEKILDDKSVSSLVDTLVDSFPEGTRFYTNYNNGSFECISNSLLDIAITMENNDGVTGFVCIEDNLNGKLQKNTD